MVAFILYIFLLDYKFRVCDVSFVILQKCFV